MTQEDKELLLRDLCARLPYGVKIHIGKTQRIEVFGDINLRIGAINNTYADIKPYLFPLSSMTEEQDVEYDATFATIVYEDGRKDFVMTYKSFDWLNKNHFDYRGLIEKGLAIDCTNLNIY